MANLSGIYKKLIVFALILGAFSASGNLSYAISEDEGGALESSEESSYDSNTAYINDIEILGSNIIKPEYILSKMTLKKGDLYDKELMQQDLKTIYRMGYFTEKMKAIDRKSVV